MKMVKTGVFAIFLGLSACSGGSVPNSDEIARMLKDGEIDRARTSVQAALDADPQNRELILLKGRVAIESGNSDLAIAELSGLMSDPAWAPRARDHLARAHLMAGKPRKALETLGESDPATALAYAVKVGALTQDGKPEEAGRLLAQGLARFPQATDLLVLDGSRAIAMGDIDRAGKIAARAVQIAPRDVQSRLLAGRVAMIGRRFDDADKHFDAVLAMRPKFQTALLAKATMAMDRGDAAGAEKLLARAAEQLGDGAPAIAYYRAQIAFNNGRTDEALKLLQAIDVSAFPPATMLSGLVAARRGQDEQAISLLRDYLSSGNEDGRARMALATSLDKVGGSGEAWEAIRPLARAANATPSTLALAARLAEAAGASEAGRLRERAVRLAKGDPMAVDIGAASKAIRAGDWAKADAIHTRLLKANPATDNVVLLNNAAYAKLELGDSAGALTLGKRALALAPDDPIVLDTVGWATFKAHGATPEAVTLMRRAASAMPSNIQIRRHSLVIAEAMRGGPEA